MQYAFGENDCYHVSKMFIKSRQWLQQNFQIGIPFIWGRMGTLVPLKVKMHMEVRHRNRETVLVYSKLICRVYSSCILVTDIRY